MNTMMAEEDDREAIRRIADSLERIENSLKDLTSKKSGLDLLPDSLAKSLLLFLRANIWVFLMFVLTMIFVAAFVGVGYYIIFWLFLKFFS